MKNYSLQEAFKNLKNAVLKDGTEITSPELIRGGIGACSVQGNCGSQGNCTSQGNSCKKQGNTNTTTISPDTTIGKAF